MATEIELLQQIAENTSDGSPLRVALVAGGSAVAGALLTAVLSYFGIRHTIRSQHAIEQQRLQATIVSAERLRWLQDIRFRMAGVYAKMDMQFNLLKRPVSEPQRSAKQSELDELSTDVMVQVNLIHLMLNPAKPAQAKLRNALQTNQAFLAAHFGDPHQAKTESSFLAYQQIKQEAFDALTEIGVETWKQVKALG
jgi:hypothetical protein